MKEHTHTPMLAHQFQVTVGNIGQVYDGNSRNEALEIRKTYIEQSKEPGNRCTLESVILWEDGEPSPHGHWEPEEELSGSELAHANGIKVFDTAIPLPVFKVLCELAGRNVVGHIVWSYDSGNIGGDPVGITEIGREAVAELISRSRFS